MGSWTHFPRPISTQTSRKWGLYTYGQNFWHMWGLGKMKHFTTDRMWKTVFSFHERIYKTTAMTLVKDTFINVSWVSMLMTLLQRQCQLTVLGYVHEYYIFIAPGEKVLRSVFHFSDIRRQNRTSILGQYQLSLSVTLRTMSLTIWFARSKLLVFSPTSVPLLLALLTFTFLDFLSNAFFACASFSFLSCQARCLCRTVLAIYHILQIIRS